MSKSLGNQTFPQDIIKQSGADILRLWVASVDYTDDQRIGAEVLKSVSDNYRKLRNTLRWMIGTLAHYSPKDAVGFHGWPISTGSCCIALRTRRRHADGLCRFRLRPRHRIAVGLHEFRSLGVLFRHSQGCALLRSAVEPKAARRAGGDRPHLSRRYALARADPRLHLRGSLGLLRRQSAIRAS